MATASHPAAARVVLSADSHTRFLDHEQVKSCLELPSKQQLFTCRGGLGTAAHNVSLCITCAEAMQVCRKGTALR